MPALSRFSPARLRLVGVLAVTQVIGWGTTFDMPGVMARKMAADVGLSIDTTFFGLTLMMLVIGLTGPVVGRTVQRMGAARVLVFGSATSTAGLALLAAADGPVGYFVAWTMIGAAGSLALSVPAYAAAVEREGAAGRRTIGVLMIFTGVSSTIFWPILDAIDAVVGWRMTLLAMAGLHLFVCLPLHVFALPPIGAHSADLEATQRPATMLDGDGAARAFLHIGVISVAFSFTTFGLAAAYLELLRGAGASVEYALWLGTVRPVVSIAARAADLVLDGRGGPLATTAAAALLMGGSFALLLTSVDGAWLLPAFVTIYAFGAGLSAMARAVLPLAFFPPDDFSRQSGRLALPQNIANAIAPVIFVAVIHHAGVAAAALLGLALMMAALASAALLAKLAHPSLPPSVRTDMP
jgi:predicted MFS family arabinose efflux permease